MLSRLFSADVPAVSKARTTAVRRFETARYLAVKPEWRLHDQSDHLILLRAAVQSCLALIMMYLIGVAPAFAQDSVPAVMNGLAAGLPASLLWRVTGARAGITK